MSIIDVKKHKEGLSEFIKNSKLKDNKERNKAYTVLEEDDDKACEMFEKLKNIDTESKLMYAYLLYWKDATKSINVFNELINEGIFDAYYVLINLILENNIRLFSLMYPHVNIDGIDNSKYTRFSNEFYEYFYDLDLKNDFLYCNIYKKIKLKEHELKTNKDIKTNDMKKSKETARRTRLVINEYSSLVFDLEYIFVNPYHSNKGHFSDEFKRLFLEDDKITNLSKHKVYIIMENKCVNFEIIEFIDKYDVKVYNIVSNIYDIVSNCMKDTIIPNRLVGFTTSESINSIYRRLNISTYFRQS